MIGQSFPKKLWSCRKSAMANNVEENANNLGLSTRHQRYKERDWRRDRELV